MEGKNRKQDKMIIAFAQPFINTFEQHLKLSSLLKLVCIDISQSNNYIFRSFERNDENPRNVSFITAQTLFDAMKREYLAENVSHFLELTLEKTGILMQRY